MRDRTVCLTYHGKYDLLKIICRVCSEDEIEQKNDIKWNGVDSKFNLPLDLRLPYYQNYLAFHFSGTEDGNFDKKVYRYLLKGADKKWSTPSEKSVSKSYLNLPHGRYTFQVVSKGFDGKWSSPAEFTFTILPPWWKTWWAYVLYMLGFSALTYVFSIYRSRQLKRANNLLEEKVKLRTKALNESISELKSTQSQLIQSEKMASLGELTAGIAHEIQNPLNFVNNFSEVSTELLEEMKEELDKGNFDEAKSISSDLKQNLEKINHHGKRADAIVKGMLQHSRANTGQKEPTDINALCDEYLKLAYHGLRAKDKSFNAQIKTDFDPNLPKINVVSQDIVRVFLNLINNAFYTVSVKSKVEGQKSGSDYEPTVSIITQLITNSPNTQNANSPTSQQSNVQITIKDNGSGIPNAIKEKIFQPFFTTKPTGQGTGLGLSLAYDIVTKGHGGTLEVTNNEDEGSEFIIKLPFKTNQL
jgi:signal transduction histidine kinase